MAEKIARMGRILSPKMIVVERTPYLASSSLSYSLDQPTSAEGEEYPYLAGVRSIIHNCPAGSSEIQRDVYMPVNCSNN
jgi:hypothetical protein